MNACRFVQKKILYTTVKVSKKLNNETSANENCSFQRTKARAAFYDAISSGLNLRLKIRVSFAFLTRFLFAQNSSKQKGHSLRKYCSRAILEKTSQFR